MTVARAGATASAPERPRDGHRAPPRRNGPAGAAPQPPRTAAPQPAPDRRTTVTAPAAPPPYATGA
ncbi:hypothetical protein ABZ840_11840 [Streptomyces sp. NPDC047117]|uniref:hypothetical protein n=1 Tax=Streptomyces sp. NPDC047117 TaxID=3155379 RepID=UPI0033E1BC1E